jgi:hypothetical protein
MSKQTIVLETEHVILIKHENLKSKQNLNPDTVNNIKTKFINFVKTKFDEIANTKCQLTKVIIATEMNDYIATNLYYLYEANLLNQLENFLINLFRQQIKYRMDIIEGKLENIPYEHIENLYKSIYLVEKTIRKYLNF